MPMLLGLARSQHPKEVQALATRLVDDLRRRGSGGVGFAMG